MRFHVGVLCASHSECLFNDHIGVSKALPCITMPDAKAMADVGALLGTQTEVCGIIIRDRVILVDERRSLRDRRDCIIDRREFFILHVDQVERLFRFAPRRCGNGCNRVTGETHALSGKHRLILDLAAIVAQFPYILWRKYNGLTWYG